MSLNFCDLLVVGSDLSGIITGTLLAKRGLNVLVLDHEGDGDRSPNLITGLNSRAFKSLLGKLMIPDTKFNLLQENPISYQMIFPKHRIDVAAQLPALLKEIGRELPQDRDVLEQLFAEVHELREKHLLPLFNQLPLTSHKEKSQFLKWFKSFPDQKLKSIWGSASPTLQTFLKAHLRFLSRGPLMDPLTFQMLLFLSPEGGATYSIRGGMRELKKIFFEKIEYFGGLVHPLGEDTMNMLVRFREVKGAQLGRYNFPTRCRYVLGNLNIQKLYGEIPSTLWSRWSKNKIKKMNRCESHGVLQYLVARDYLPEPLKDNVLLIQDSEQPLSGINFLELNLQTLPRPVEEFDTLLTIHYLLPPNGLNEGPAYFEEFHRAIEEKCLGLFPFARGHMRPIFPIMKREGSNLPEGDLFPEARDKDFEEFKLFMDQRAAYTPSLFTPSLASPFKNLFTVGPNLLDWLGMEGKMLAAMKSVNLIWQKEQKARS